MKLKIAATVLLLILSASFASAQLEFRTESPIDSMSSFDMNGNRIFNLSDPVEGQDATTKAWTENTFVNRNGDTLTGVLDFNGNNIQLSDAYISNDGEDEGIVIDNQGNVMISQGNLELLDNGNVTGLYSLEAESDEIEVRDSIDLDGNNITDIGTLLFETGLTINGSINTSGGDVNLDNGSISNVYSIGGGGDAVKFSDNIDLNGNTLTDTTGDVEIDSSVYIPGGSLDMAGNNIVNPGNVDGVDLDNPGNAINISDSRLQILANAISNEELDNSDSYTINGLTSNDNIDLSGNNITNIDTLFFETGMNINGSVNTNGGDLNLDDGDLNDVNSIDGAGDPVDLEDDIRLNNNDIIEPNQIQTGGSGSDTITIRDTSGTGQDIARFNEGGNVEIPSGNLDVGDSSNTGSKLDVAGDIRFDNRIIPGKSIAALRNTDNTQDVIKWENSGRVVIPNGDLSLKVSGQDAGNDITGVETISGRDNLVLQGQGSSQGVVLQQGDGKNVLEAGAGNQNVQVNSNLGVGTNPSATLHVAGQNSNPVVLIEPETMNGGDTSTLRFSDPDSGTSTVDLEYSDSGDASLVVDGGDFEITEGDIDLQGNSVVDSTSSNSVTVGDGSDDNVNIDAGGSGTVSVSSGDGSSGSTERLAVTSGSGNADVDVQNADVDMNGNSIENYYSDQCSTGNALADIENDGELECVDIADEVMDVYVNRSGDSMTGDLDMRGNDVYNVSNAGVGTDNPQENLDVDGTASVENGGTRMEVDGEGNVVVTLGS